MSITTIQSLVPEWLTIVDAVAKATLLVGTAALGALLLRRASAASRHLVWTLALVSALLLPALSRPLPRWELPLVTLQPDVAPAAAATSVPSAAPRQHQVRRGATPAEASAPAPPESAAAARSLSWPTLLLIIWAAGAAAILARLAVGLLAVQWISS